MSRVGRMPITVPAGVEVKVEGRQHRHRQGAPRGTPDPDVLPPIITIAQEGNEDPLRPSSDDKATRAMHGTVRSVLNGMVVGVSEGFTKELQVNGIGYRVAKEGRSWW